VDYLETFAPVATINSVRTVLSIAAIEDMELSHLDVIQAFLLADIDEEVYIKQPDGYVVQGQESKVCKLNKALYGLKQAPHLWNTKLIGILKDMGLRQSKTDLCIFTGQYGGAKVLLSIHVDDMLCAFGTKQSQKKFIEHVASRVDIKNLGTPSYYLGFEITRNRIERTINIHQQAKIIALIDSVEMMNCKPIATPADPSVKLTNEMSPRTDEDNELMRNIPYRSAVGKLLHISLTTRPDISYAVSCVARFNANPGNQHWSAVKRIIRYLKGTSNFGPTIGGGEILPLHYQPILMLIGLKTLKPEDPPAVIFAKLGKEQFCGIAKDNKLLHCRQLKLNIWLLLQQLKMLYY